MFLCHTENSIFCSVIGWMCSPARQSGLRRFFTEGQSKSSEPPTELNWLQVGLTQAHLRNLRQRRCPLPPCLTRKHEFYMARKKKTAETELPLFSASTEPTDWRAVIFQLNNLLTLCHIIHGPNNEGIFSSVLSNWFNWFYLIFLYLFTIFYFQMILSN